MRTCYYHKQPITRFCTHPKCTLPLCHQCIPIHHQQTKNIISHNFDRHVKDINDAVKLALEWIANDKKDKEKSLAILYTKINDVREQVIKKLDENLAVLREDINKKLQLEQKYLKRIEEEGMVQGGSIKQLIKIFQYYGWHQNNVQSVLACKQVENYHFSFDSNKLSQIIHVQKRLNENPVNNNNQISSSPQHQSLKRRKSPKKGIILTIQSQNHQNSQVQQYYSTSKEPIWKSVVNTNSVNIKSPRSNTNTIKSPRSNSESLIMLN